MTQIHCGQRPAGEVALKRAVVALLVALALGLLAAPLIGDAQPPARVPRIGVLYFSAPGSPRVEPFRQGLRELGYVEGQSIAIDYRYAERRVDRYADLAAEVVRLEPDAIVVWGTALTRAVQRATKTIPVVFALADQPVAMGLVGSLSRPGGNITGLSSLNFELSPKRLELLKEALPKVTRVAILWSPYPLAAPALQETNVAGRALGIQLQSVEVRSPNDFDGAFAQMTKERAGALLVLPGGFTGANGSRIAGLALKHRLPTIFTSSPEFVAAGGLIGYGPNILEMSRCAAVFVDKILKGAKPADLPVEQPTKFEFVVNLRTAKTLGLTIPQSVLIRADEVIQ